MLSQEQRTDLSLPAATVSGTPLESVISAAHAAGESSAFNATATHQLASIISFIHESSSQSVPTKAKPRKGRPPPSPPSYNPGSLGHVLDSYPRHDQSPRLRASQPGGMNAREQHQNALLHEHHPDASREALHCALNLTTTPGWRRGHIPHALLKQPPRNPVLIRPGTDSPAHRKSAVHAILASIVGTVRPADEMCIACRANKGPFQGCINATGLNSNGGCTNCHYYNRSSRCTRSCKSYAIYAARHTFAENE